jgi:hypothetical protein
MSQALSTTAAVNGTETEGFFLIASGKGIVFNPLPFSKAKVSSEAHCANNQKCSMRCCVPSSQRRMPDLPGKKLSVSTKNNLPSLSLRNGLAQFGFAHLCSMAASGAFKRPHRICWSQAQAVQAARYSATTIEVCTGAACRRVWGLPKARQTLEQASAE